MKYTSSTGFQGQLTVNDNIALGMLNAMLSNPAITDKLPDGPQILKLIELSKTAADLWLVQREIDIVEKLP